MSIINDALKKLQKDMTGHLAVTPSAPETPAQSSTPVELTPAQKAGFQPVPQTSQPLNIDKNSTTLKETKIKKQTESKLVYILGILCLLTGLFAPIMNKQSVIEMLLERWPKKPSVMPQTQKNIKAIELKASEPQIISSNPIEPIQTQAPSLVENIKKIVSPNPTTAPMMNRIIVNGIMSTGDKNIVLIDGQIYEEGENVGGIKIIKINSSNIIVLENGKERTIKVMGR